MSKRSNYFCNTKILRPTAVLNHSTDIESSFEIAMAFCRIHHLLIGNGKRLIQAETMRKLFIEQGSVIKNVDYSLSFRHTRNGFFWVGLQIPSNIIPNCRFAFLGAQLIPTVSDSLSLTVVSFQRSIKALFLSSDHLDQIGYFSKLQTAADKCKLCVANCFTGFHNHLQTLASTALND